MDLPLRHCLPSFIVQPPVHPPPSTSHHPCHCRPASHSGSSHGHFNCVVLARSRSHQLPWLQIHLVISRQWFVVAVRCPLSRLAPHNHHQSSLIYCLRPNPSTALHLCQFPSSLCTILNHPECVAAPLFSVELSCTHCRRPSSLPPPALITDF